MSLFDIFNTAITNASELGIQNVTEACYVPPSQIDDLGVPQIREDDRQFGTLSAEKREEIQALLHDPILAQTYARGDYPMPLRVSLTAVHSISFGMIYTPMHGSMNV